MPRRGTSGGPGRPLLWVQVSHHETGLDNRIKPRRRSGRGAHQSGAISQSQSASTSSRSSTCLELVDAEGRQISFWGVDRTNYAVLAFGNYSPTGETSAGGSHLDPYRLDDPQNQRMAVGIVDGSPFVKLKSADGKTQIRMMLSVAGKPFILHG